MGVARIFSLGALPYDFMTGQSIWRDHCRTMMARFPVQERPPRVLDLGCGPANSAIELWRAGAGQVVGLDLAAGMLRRGVRRLRAAGGPPIGLVRGDATRLPVRSEVFDAVTGHSFLYLVPDPAAVLHEARRVLRPGGRLVLMEPAAGPPGWDLVPQLLRSARFAISMAGWRLMSAVHRRYTAASLARALADAGFAAVSVERTLGGLGLLASGERPAAART
jgi:ubiquinone/menaquinone biosynthesis C-methylase UbiE